MLSRAKQYLEAAKDAALTYEQNALTGVFFVDDIENVGAVGDDRSPRGALGRSREHIVLDLAGDEQRSMLQVEEGLIFPAGIVDAVQLAAIDRVEFLRSLHYDLHRVEHTCDRAEERDVKVISVELLRLTARQLLSRLREAAVVRRVAHKLVIGDGDGLGVADQVERLALHFGQFCRDVVDLAALGIGRDPPLEQRGGYPLPLFGGNGAVIK